MGTELCNTISIGRNYLTSKVKLQYAEHFSALIREFTQNALDSSALNLSYVFNREERTLRITDDGRGMNSDILVNALFNLGGSYKETKKATGGFGAAKLILFFQHEWFEITTYRDGKKHFVKGECDKYSDIEVTDDATGVGTSILIKFLPEYGFKKYWNGEQIDEFCQFEYIATQYLKDCNFSANITWNGEKINPSIPGQLFRKLDWSNIYFKPLEEGILCSNFIKIRINGLLMFKSYVSKMSKEVTVELSYDSLTCLNENRDGLKGTFQTELQSLMGEFAKDCDSFARLSGKVFRFIGEKQSFRYLCRKTIFEYSQSIIKKITDKIKRCAEMDWKEELSRLETMKDAFLNDFDSIVKNHSESIEETINKMAEDIMYVENNMNSKEQIAKINTEGLKRLVEAMSISAKTMGIEAEETKEEILANIDKDSQVSSTKHDFIVKVDKKLNVLPRNINPSTLSPKFERLMQLYVHSIKTISEKLDHNVTFRFGWILSDDALAMFTKENDEVTFLINPESKKWFEADSKANCVKRIARTAAHEFVHYLGITYHDESFNAQYDTILEKLDTISSWTKFESDAYEINI